MWSWVQAVILAGLSPTGQAGGTGRGQGAGGREDGSGGRRNRALVSYSIMNILIKGKDSCCYEQNYSIIFFGQAVCNAQKCIWSGFVNLDI